MYVQSERHWTESAEKRVADVVDEIRTWLEEKLAEQEKKPLTEDPVFLASELTRKVLTWGFLIAMLCSLESGELGWIASLRWSLNE